jgi:nicotinamide-nucleotide amidase
MNQETPPVDSSQAENIQRLLETTGQQLVLAESCTSGLVAARIGSLPGISAHFCGSAVVYQEQTKQQWLGISEQTLQEAGVVSSQVASQMAQGALQSTAQATLAAAITGHLGPDAPAELDGQLELGIASRNHTDGTIETVVRTIQLPEVGRAARQQLAAQHLLQLVERALLVVQAWQGLQEQPQSCWSIPSWNGASPAEPAELVFPGAFAPCHEGHVEIMRAAQQAESGQLALEISLENVDKPALSAAAAVARVVPLAEIPVWLTRAATFVEKAQRFAGCTLVVGADTLARIGQPRYYTGGEAAMLAAIDQIAAAGNRFLVFGRKMNGQFQTGRDSEQASFMGLDELDIPAGLRELCQPVSEDAFRRDISSRDL